MTTDSITITLIRHGESQAQVDGLLSGHDDCSGLSAHGRSQADRLAERLRLTGELADATAVYTSVIDRAKETAARISVGLPDVPQVADRGFCEVHAQAAEGLPWDEVRRRYPYDAFHGNPFSRHIPGGESFGDLYVRVGERLMRVYADHRGEHVVVVTHGGVVGASFVAFGDLPISRARSFVNGTQNTSLTTWRWSPATGGDLLRYNDTAHLSDLVQARSRD